MRLRTQLMLMFGIVAIVPLTVVTLQGYLSSENSYRRAVEAEAETLAESMSSDMERFTLELSRRMARLRQKSNPDRSEDYERARRDALAQAEQAQARETLQGVLTRAQVEQGDIPFGLDADGQPIARHATDQSVLNVLSEAGLKVPGEPGSSIQALGDWVVVLRRDPASGLTLAIARPIGDEMRDIRQSAARNLGYGLVMAVAALLTIRPLSRRLTRNLARVTEGAERLAKGDLTVRVPVRSKDELGELQRPSTGWPRISRCTSWSWCAAKACAGSSSSASGSRASCFPARRCARSPRRCTAGPSQPVPSEETFSTTSVCRAAPSSYSSAMSRERAFRPLC